MRRPILGFVAVLTFATSAFGDGCYMPERAVRRIPEIPAQRAVLTWKDGVETLVIASALDSESQKLGWLIPIPSVPWTMEKATPGALKTLSFRIQPEITHDLCLQLTATIVIVILANLLLGTWLFKRKSLPSLLVVLAVLFILWSLMLPALGTGGVALTKASNVNVEKSATVGSYDISILRPSKPDDLNAWLAENGYASLPEAANESVADYISQGWVFAATKLTRTVAGENTPHPIKMVFAAKEPVYPVRLTALAGGSPEFEIFVIANDRASCDMLKEEFCDRFSMTMIDDEEYEEDGRVYAAKGEAYVGEATACTIGHPAICSLMWENCVLTKFAGTISAGDMTTDVRFKWKPFQSCQQHVYTVAGARDSALILFIWSLGASVLISMAVCRNRIAGPRGLRWYSGRVLLPVIAVLAFVAGIMFAALPKLDVSQVQISGAPLRHQQFFAFILCRDIDLLLTNHPDVLRGTAEEIAEYILKNVRKSAGREETARNRTTDSELRVEDSPGNFTVEKHGDKVAIRVYNLFGVAIRIDHSTPAPGENAKPDTTGS